jgi:hypothetical protein
MIDELSYDYFLDNKEKFLREHAGKYIVIKNGKLCAMYVDELSLEANARKYGNDLLILYLDTKEIKEYKLKS